MSQCGSRMSWKVAKDTSSGVAGKDGSDQHHFDDLRFVGLTQAVCGAPAPRLKVNHITDGYFIIHGRVYYLDAVQHPAALKPIRYTTLHLSCSQNE